MESRITAFDPPRKLTITWGDTGGVTFELERQDGEVLLTLTRHRVADRSVLLNVIAGWHAHLNPGGPHGRLEHFPISVKRLSGRKML